MKTNGTRILLIAVVVQLLVLIFSFSFGARTASAPKTQQPLPPSYNGYQNSFAGINADQVEHAAYCASSLR